MTDRRDFLKHSAALAAATLPAAGWAAAGDAGSYPDRQIKIIVPYAPGGFNDTLARIMSEHLQQRWKQTVLVENRAGGGTTLATQMVAKSPADGYTLLVTPFPFAVNPLVYSNLGYTLKSFAPVFLAGRSPYVVVVPTNSPYQTLADLIRGAKEKPGALNYGTSGVAAGNHLAMELFCDAVGVRMNHVPYRGGAPTMADLVGGQLDCAFDLLPNALPFVQSGKLRCIGVGDNAPSPTVPNAPTIAKALGQPFETVSWHGFVAPADTPPAVVQKLNEEMNTIIARPDVKAIFAAQGVTPSGGTPAQFAAFIDGQTNLYKPIIAKKNIKVE